MSTAYESGERTNTELRELVASASRRLAASGLVVGTAGNVSARSGSRVAVTATGAELGTLTASEVTVVSLSGEVIEGELAPTSELDLHLGVYRATPPAMAVVHAHSTFATTLSVAIDELPVIHYQQLALGGAIRVAPFAVFGTPELAAHVEAALAGKKAAIMASHGAVAWGSSMKDAVDNLELLEWACELYWRARVFVGAEPRVMTIEQQVAVAEHAMRTGYGSTRKRS